MLVPELFVCMIASIALCWVSLCSCWQAPWLSLGCFWRMNVTVYCLQCDERAVRGGTTVCSPLKVPWMLEHGLPGCLLIPPTLGGTRRAATHSSTWSSGDTTTCCKCIAEVCTRRMAILLSPRPCRPFPRASLRPLFANAPARNSSFYVGGPGG